MNGPRLIGGCVGVVAVIAILAGLTVTIGFLLGVGWGLAQ